MAVLQSQVKPSVRHEDLYRGNAVPKFKVRSYTKAQGLAMENHYLSCIDLMNKRKMQEQMNDRQAKLNEKKALRKIASSGKPEKRGMATAEKARAERKRAIGAVRTFLKQQPEPLTLTQISSEMGLNRTTVRSYLTALLKAQRIHRYRNQNRMYSYAYGRGNKAKGAYSEVRGEDLTRLLLVEAGKINAPFTATELAEKVGVQRAAAANRLNKLHAEGLFTKKKVGYSYRYEAVSKGSKGNDK